jgi:hypothetical protein
MRVPVQALDAMASFYDSFRSGWQTHFPDLDRLIGRAARPARDVVRSAVASQSQKAPPRS